MWTAPCSIYIFNTATLFSPGSPPTKLELKCRQTQTLVSCFWLTHKKPKKKTSAFLSTFSSAFTNYPPIYAYAYHCSAVPSIACSLLHRESNAFPEELAKAQFDVVNTLSLFLNLSKEGSCNYRLFIAIHQQLSFTLHVTSRHKRGLVQHNYLIKNSTTSYIKSSCCT